MKKIFLAIFLGIFCIGLIAPIVSKAQLTKLQECCKLGHNVKIMSGKLVATPTTGCVKDKNDADITTAGTDCTKNVPCIFQKKCTVGPKEGTICARPNLGGTSDAKVDVSFKDWGLICIVNTIHTITNWLFYIMLLLAVLMAVIGGFLYMTAAGDPERAGKGKKIVIFSMIGLAIALLSRAIPSIIRAVMGM